MPPVRLLLPALVALVLLAVPAGASADRSDPTGFRFASAAFVAHESDPGATITVTRADARNGAQIRYITVHDTAVPYQDYTPVKGRLDFAPGQAASSFTVPIVDHHMPGATVTVKLGLFGASPIGLAQPSNAVLTIREDDALSVVRNPLNPLGLAAAPPASNPLFGGRAFDDLEWNDAERQIRAWHGRHPRAAKMLQVIAQQPLPARFGNWTTNVDNHVSSFLARAAAKSPGTVPEIATYWLNNGKCGHYSDSPARAALYHRWTVDLARGIAGYRAILFLDMDAILTTGCLSSHGLQVRLAELRDAIGVLAQQPRLVVYLDGGAADGLSASRTAWLLNHAGVAFIQGFFLNSTHYDWTSREIRYGWAVSRMTGGKHFVVSTTVNGRGPLKPPHPVRQGNEVLCNPPGRGLGPRPTFNTGFRLVDAFAWLGIPGRSGHCTPNSPPADTFWPALAEAQVRNADFRVR